jgi:TonB family protein
MSLAKATPERLTLFSDAVFAVLITVLVLELRPPPIPTFKSLLSLWPTWLSYAVSYLFIAIVWSNHHHLLRYAAEVTPRLMWFNFAHLFSVSLLPLATAWMAVSELAPQPVAFYAAVFFLVNATYIFLIRELVDPTAVDAVSLRVRRIMRFRSIATLCLFGLAAAVALKYPLVGLGICCCCLIVYLRPEAPGAAIFVLLSAVQVLLPHRSTAQEPAVRLERCERPRAPLGVLTLEGEIAFQLRDRAHPDTASVTVLRVSGSSAPGMRSAMVRLLPACRFRRATSPADGLWILTAITLDSSRFEIGDPIVLSVPPVDSLSAGPDSAAPGAGEVVDADHPLLDERPRALKCKLPAATSENMGGTIGENRWQWQERARRQGIVRLSFVVDSTGRVSRDSIQVRESPHPWLNTRAIGLVASCRFAPGRLQRHAVAVRSTWLFYIRN